MHLDQIKQVKKKYESEWLKIPSVVGVGIGILDGDNMGIIISIKSPDDSVRAAIPKTVDGIGVEIRISGAIEAQ